MSGKGHRNGEHQRNSAPGGYQRNGRPGRGRGRTPRTPWNNELPDTSVQLRQKLAETGFMLEQSYRGSGSYHPTAQPTGVPAPLSLGYTGSQKPPVTRRPQSGARNTNAQHKEQSQGNSASRGSSQNYRVGRDRVRSPQRHHSDTRNTDPQKQQPGFSQNPRRGRHHSQGRPAWTQAAQTHRSEDQRPPGDRPQSGKNNSARQKDHRGDKKQPSLSARAVSQPDLLRIGHNLQDGHFGVKQNVPPNQRPPMIHKLDYRSLERILQMEPAEVVMKLAAPGSGLKEFLNRQDCTDPLMSLTLDVLCKACSSQTNRQNLQHLLLDVKESHFLRSVMPLFIMELVRPKEQENMEEAVAKLNKIMELYLTLMSIFPSSTIAVVSLAVTLMETQIAQMNNYVGFSLPEETQTRLTKLQRTINHLRDKKREGTFVSDNYNFLLGDEDESGVENFRAMSVVPTYKDIHMTEKPFIRPNIVTEKFEDSSTYLDTHFRLLREDFIKPLRDGISYLLTFGESVGRKRLDDIRIYFDTHVVHLLCTPKGILYKLKFDNQGFKSVNWENSKRLLYGALVCLSMDDFDTMIFATVAHRDVNELKKGVINVSFNEENRQRLESVGQKDAFLMVETTAFFEAYRHVLEGLQEINAEDLPFQRYIVRCESNILPPKYLQGSTSSYSLQALTNDRKISVTKKKTLFPPGGVDINTMNTERLKDILNLDEWPSKEKLRLDSSQMRAVQLALTKELAIIQGPPGTGKTHVGLKIVKTLLDNSQIWNSGADPILVVCYTNHALDQFLEGIVNFMSNTSGLVRVGGRSSSKVVCQLSLTELRRKGHTKSSLPGHLRAMFGELKDNMKELENLIEEMAAQLESSGSGILHESVLERYIRSLHGARLEDGLGHTMRKQTAIMEWLGVAMLNTAPRNVAPMDLDMDLNLDHTEDEDLMYFYEDTAASGAGEDGEGAMSDEGLAQETAKLSLRAQGGAEAGSLVEARGEADCDDDAEDYLRVSEEADQEQALRMTEDDDVEMHIHNAQRRMADIQKQALAYELEEEQKEGQDESADADDEGWMITKKMKKKLKGVVKAELRKTEHMSEEMASQVLDLWTLSYKDRWSLYRLWVSKYQAKIRADILKATEKYQSLVMRLEELRNIEDETILKNASVIGMTTTCAARYRKVLQGIQPKIVVVEEAAEVLEAHIVTALTAACQHLILIGDHQQLRPSATVYELATRFNLEVSLFERLIKMDVPYVRLDYQHRMRPSIARLLTPHIYDKLENDASVYQYEDLKGVTSNVFFVDHKHLEENITEGRSHQNMHEATFVKSLCNYLICQGYKPSQITVLTTYTGQLFCLKKVMQSIQFKGVNICVVDRFQGEENDIIILSLVRSNKEGKVGFLKIPNRVCVALSRAKKGLFCIGNMSMLSTVPLWKDIQKELCAHGQIGEALNLRCENHPTTLTAVSKAEHFQKVPLGGCSLPCEYRLDCGHVCPRLCHPIDDHKQYKCQKPCTKTLCESGHKCPKVCSAKCGDCQVMVLKKIPACGHEQNVPCSTPAEKFQCPVPCEKTLPCGHLCVRSCFETCTRKCPEKVAVTLECGHKITLLCHVKQEADSRQQRIQCRVKCATRLDCSHLCSGNCSECKNGAEHIACAAQCEVQLFCSHFCQEKCGKVCAPCSRACRSGCIHKKCSGQCSEACQPCKKACSWRCRHQQCTRLCGEPCDRPPCHMPCSEQLPCRHPCIGVCGEPCPNRCRICNADEVQELFFGNEADPEALFVQLLDCGHIFEVTGFDSWMEVSDKNELVDLKSCPKCRTPIQRSVRYNAVVKRVQLEIETLSRMAAKMYSGVIIRSVKEREDNGIRSTFIAPVLAKLSRPTLDIRQAAFIDKQVLLLSQLAAVTRNVEKLPKWLQSEISHRVALCSAKVRDAKGGDTIQELGQQVKRIWFFTEAQALADMHLRSQTGVSSTFTLERQLLNNILHKLDDTEDAPTETDFRGMRTGLRGISDKLNAPIHWDALNFTSITHANCGFLKLNHWSRCSRGHIYYKPPAEGALDEILCPECTEGQTNW